MKLWDCLLCIWFPENFAGNFAWFVFAIVQKTISMVYLCKWSKIDSVFFFDKRRNTTSTKSRCLYRIFELDKESMHRLCIRPPSPVLLTRAKLGPTEDGVRPNIGITFPILGLAHRITGWTLETPYHHWKLPWVLRVFDVSHHFVRQRRHFQQKSFLIDFPKKTSKFCFPPSFQPRGN